jgi:23S rRNA (guanosine2251-2'-O)-methyltransferase
LRAAAGWWLLAGMARQNRDCGARDNRHARGSRGGGGPAPGEADLERIVARAPVPFLLLLDCVQDPHNLGAILRTAEGAGVDAVIAPRDKAVGLTETVRRISVGAADRVPFVRVTNLVRTMQKLKEAGVWLVGTSDRAGRSFYELDLAGPLGLVMGSEEKGLRRLTEENCDFLAALPMAGGVDCLNVSVATGICLYEALRQRSAVRRPG